jgi:transposase
VAAHQKGAVNTRAWIVFLDESGVSLLPQVRRTYAPRGRTPLLRHRLNWKRASMAAALGYHAADPAGGPRLCFHLKPGSYDTTALIKVLEQLKVFYRGERVVLVWDGLSAHWSRAMRSWGAEQDWLTLERLPAYAPELNPVELLWSSLKKSELANLAGDHLADVADATEQGIHRINQNRQLPWSFLTHTGLTIHPPTHRTNEKISRTAMHPGSLTPRTVAPRLETATDQQQHTQPPVSHPTAPIPRDRRWSGKAPTGLYRAATARRSPSTGMSRWS